MKRGMLSAVAAVFMGVLLMTREGFAEDMDAMWGEQVSKLKAEDAERGELFKDGNYAMFIHWGLYSHIGNQYKGRNYYGIGEWIKHKAMAGIPDDEYRDIAREFNPVKFDAMEIAQLAKDAGMKYIIITSKHHDGFAMYHSKANKFNIVDATPFRRDPMKELAKACEKVGIGFGFYYSHNQDWTFPGGNGGPKTDAEGNEKTFDDYFKEKCLPQVKEITSEYGPIVIVWFDTPGKMPKSYVEELVDVVRKNQPKALISGRAGHGLGDYRSLGDMEVPQENEEGMWEGVDTTNDSWAYAWYDNYWKSPREILHRLIATVARGGTYMLNIGPRGDGTVPERAARSLRASGEWIKRYPQVVYGTDASPWKHALPWGDITVRDNRLFLSIFEWPSSGELCLPGLKTEIKSVRLLKGSDSEQVKYKQHKGWTIFTVPDKAPEKLVSVVEVTLKDKPETEPVWGIDPGMDTEISVHFAEVTGAEKKRRSWMEKFGEWKHVVEVTKWSESGRVVWEVDVLKPGDYNIDLTYAGEGRVVWGVDIEGGEHIQNQQNSSHNYQRFAIGWLNFSSAGHYRVSVSCLEGNLEKAALKSIHFTPVQF